MPRLGVNIDHVATLRQARLCEYPSPLVAAKLAVEGGADNITMHLREDRRHIQDKDVFAMAESLRVPINFEMAATKEMLGIAMKIRPSVVTLVPEKRQELTTEGGLVLGGNQNLLEAIEALHGANLSVSLFIDPNEKDIILAHEMGVGAVELHSGEYASAPKESDVSAKELARLSGAATVAAALGLEVHVGHGLHYENIKALAAISSVHSFQIGHAIVAKALELGMREAVAQMKQLTL